MTNHRLAWIEANMPQERPHEDDDSFNFWTNLHFAWFLCGIVRGVGGCWENGFATSVLNRSSDIVWC